MARPSISHVAVAAACALSLAAGGCATPADQTASLQWQFNGSQFAQEGTSAEPAYYGKAYAANSSSDTSALDVAASEGSAASDWAEKTYVYRGGRDPKTGLALNRM